jgi:hypothetical protein
MLAVILLFLLFCGNDAVKRSSHVCGTPPKQAGPMQMIMKSFLEYVALKTKFIKPLFSMIHHVAVWSLFV